MYCTNCGKPITKNAAFCISCGSMLGKTQTPSNDNSKTQANSIKPKKTRYALAVLFGFLMFVFCVSALMSFIVRQALSPIAIERMISQIDIPNIRVGQMLDLEGEAYDRNIPLYEWVYTELHVAGIPLDDVTMQTVENLLYLLPICDFLSSTLTRYANGLFAGNENVHVTARELVGFIRRNDRLISRHLGIVITEEELGELYNVLNEAELPEVTHLGTVLDDAGVNLTLVRWGLSLFTLIGFTLLALSMLACMLFLCNLSFRETFMYLGTISVCVCAVFGISRITFGVLISNIMPSSFDEALVNALTRGIQNSILLTALVFMIIGAVLITLSVVIGIKRQAKIHEVQKS